MLSIMPLQMSLTCAGPHECIGALPYCTTGSRASACRTGSPSGRVQPYRKCEEQQSAPTAVWARSRDVVSRTPISVAWPCSGARRAHVFVY